jgi:hypothetical protein
MFVEMFEKYCKVLSDFQMCASIKTDNGSEISVA